MKSLKVSLGILIAASILFIGQPEAKADCQAGGNPTFEGSNTCVYDGPVCNYFEMYLSSYQDLLYYQQANIGSGWGEYYAGWAGNDPSSGYFQLNMVICQ